MEHRLDHELDRKDEREEPELCGVCYGTGWGGDPENLYDCHGCNGTGFKQEESDDESIPF